MSFLALSPKPLRTPTVLALAILSGCTSEADPRSVLGPDGGTSDSDSATAGDTVMIHAAPSGTENASGNEDDPLSLDGARRKVRELKRRGPGAIEVVLAGGVYRLEQTFVLGRDDGGHESRTIRYRPRNGEKPVFTSLMPIDGWRRPKNVPVGLPAIAQNKIWAADVSQLRQLKRARDGHDHDWRFRTLYREGEALPRARGPEWRPAAGSPRHGRYNYFYAPTSLSRYSSFDDAELLLVPEFEWIMNILEVASANTRNNTLTLASEATYRTDRGRTRAWLENVIEELDKPGEWVLDSDTATLFYWPADEQPPEDIGAPLLTELVRIEGEIEVEAAADRPVTDIELRGITFTGTDRLPWQGRTGLGLQHDWEMFDRATAMVRLRGTERCVVADNTFIDAGHTGLRLDLHAQDNRIEGNHFTRLGGVGILLAGYGPGTKDVNGNNVVRNNYIHHIGRHYWASPGIFVWQSGDNQILHNTLHDLPYSGIVVSGRIQWDPSGIGQCSRTIRWNEVEPILGTPPPKDGDWPRIERFLHARRNEVARNDVFHVVKRQGDGNCIYVSGAGAANRIVENYCHDCFGERLNAGLRADDIQHETLFAGNIVRRQHGKGEGIIIKGRNDIINNFLIDLRPTPPATHRGYIVLLRESPAGAEIKRNVLYGGFPGLIPVGQGLPYAGGNFPGVFLSDSDAGANLYYHPLEHDWATAHLRNERAKGVEQTSRQEDPHLSGLEHGGVSFAPESAATVLGIEASPTASAFGIESSFRARWIEEELSTQIRPRSQPSPFPQEVTISTSSPSAAIHYTLDGSEVTQQSPRYTGPFELYWPRVVRAKAFAGDAVDLVGASESYFAPMGWVVEGFETHRSGRRAYEATTTSGQGYDAIVSDERAASGARSLRFSDGPGQAFAHTPHVRYQPGVSRGEWRLSFAIFLDAASECAVYFRDYQSRTPYATGLRLQLFPGGQVDFGSQTATVPVRRWVRVTVQRRLGSTSPNSATASVRWSNGGYDFRAEAFDPAFARVDRFGFVANGERLQTFFVDDIRFERLD